MLGAAVRGHVVRSVKRRPRAVSTLITGLAAPGLLFQHHATPLRPRVLEPDLKNNYKILKHDFNKNNKAFYLRLYT